MPARPANPHEETLTQSGRCGAHGAVQAIKRVPEVRFPFLVFGALRLWANRRPFCCPVCGAPVTRA